AEFERRKPDLLMHSSRRFIGHDPYPAVFHPLVKDMTAFRFVPGDHHRLQSAFTANLVMPVSHHPGWTNHHKAASMIRSKVRQGCQGLDGFTQPHFITEQGPPLYEGIACAKTLIAAQMDFEQRCVEWLLPHRIHNVCRQPTRGSRSVGLLDA